MQSLTLPLEPDELAGLDALRELSRAAGSKCGPDAAATARMLLRASLVGKLNEYGLPWAPAPQAVSRRVAEAAAPRRSGLTQNPKVRKGVAWVLALVLVVTLWGGYIQHWKWTGFTTNGQLWSWLSLLLLPTIIALIPLLIQDRKYFSRTRLAVYSGAALVWCAFVAAGYLIPLGWTGFSGVTLWQWFGLLLLPGALAITTALTAMHLHLWRVLRSLRPAGKIILVVLAAGWAVTVIGGYVLNWRWTGYNGNSLWDWLNLLLAPIAFPAIVQPALLKWITGDAADRASHAAEAPPDRVPAAAA